MVHRTFMLLAVAASTAAFAAGCGSSSSTTKSSTPSTSAPSTSTSSATQSSNPAVTQAVAQCKSSINAQPSLSASVKSKLVTVCDKAATGDVNGAKKATAQVCQEIVKATVPAQAQTQALAACPKQ